MGCDSQDASEEQREVSLKRQTGVEAASHVLIPCLVQEARGEFARPLMGIPDGSRLSDFVVGRGCSFLIVAISRLRARGFTPQLVQCALQRSNAQAAAMLGP